MQKDIGTRIRDKILPYFVFPTVVGVVTGVLIFIFKVVSSFVMHKSEQVYSFVRENPIYLPVLLAGTALIGFIAGNLASSCSRVNKALKKLLQAISGVQRLRIKLLNGIKDIIKSS